MAESTTLKGALLAIVAAAGVAMVGSTQQPWWWCQFARCTPKQPTSTDTKQGTSDDGTDTKPKTPAPPTMSAIEPNSNRNGGDYVPSQHVANAEACRSLCNDDDSCKAMTFVTDLSDPASGGICWLKNSVPPSTPNSHMASAVKEYR